MCNYKRIFSFSTNQKIIIYFFVLFSAISQTDSCYVKGDQKH